MKNLIADIKEKLGITGGQFIDAEIESYVESISPDEYLDFFKALSGEHNFSKPMDRVANVAAQFANKKEQLILAGTFEQAKAMYDKFYNRCSLMLDYCRENRETIPSDRAFFEAQDYKTLADVNGQKIFSKQEAYVLNELGGGSWLCDIRFLANSAVAIDKIENIIKRGKITKYLNTGNAITDKRVSKMLQGVA